MVKEDVRHPAEPARPPERARLRLHFFGAPQVTLAGQPVGGDLRRKALALLAYLAVEERSHTREALATLLWPDYPQTSALAYLRRTLWELTSHLGSAWFDADRQQVSFVWSPDAWLDCRAFERLASASPTLATLAGAETLYQDHFLAGFTLPDAPEFDAWQAQVRQRLQAQMAQTLNALVAGWQAAGDPAQALAYARRLLSLDPLQEDAHRQLMRLYAQTGQRAAALRQYEACRQRLSEELGVAPAAETTALWQQIRAGEGFATPAAPTAPAGAEPITVTTPPPPLVRLPAGPTPFVGRQEELRTLASLLADPTARLITLLGPGGTGKTRLAIAAAQAAAGQFPDGVTFVPLAPLSDAGDILPALAKSLDIAFFQDERESPRQQIMNYLRPKKLLLVMDNYEHLADPAGIELLVEMLATAPQLRILATSRARLNAPGERLFPVAGLLAPDQTLPGHEPDPAGAAARYSALALFRQSAAQVQPGFALTAQNIGPVSDICRLLQGLPLGIELAAAWLPLLSPAEIAAEIGQSLDFLDDPGPGRPQRQRSLRAVFDSSWNLLTPAEQQAFLPLTVFRGGFTRQAAEQVSGSSLRLLLGLVNKSWLQRAENDRFQVHEMLRQYGHEQLSQLPEAWDNARQRHSDYFARLLAEQEPALRGPDQRQALALVAGEFENIRTAWWWRVDQGQYDVIVWQMMPALLRLMTVLPLASSLLNLLRLLEEALDRAAGPEIALYQTITYTMQSILYQQEWRETLVHERAVRAWALAEAGGPERRRQMRFWNHLLTVSYAWAGDLAVGRAHLEESLPQIEAQDDAWYLAWSYEQLAQIYRQQGAYARAGDYYSRALALFRQVGDAFEVAQCLRGLASLARIGRDYDRAITLLEQVQTLLQEAGSQLWAASIEVFDLVELYLQQGRLDDMFALLANRRRYFEQVGDRQILLLTLHWQSIFQSRYGVLEQAIATRRRHLALTQELARPDDAAWSLWELAELYRLAGDLAEARSLLRQAESQFSPALPLAPAFVHRLEAELALAAGDYAPAQALFQMAHDVAVAQVHGWGEAYALDGLGQAALGLGNWPEAEAHFRAAIRLAMDLGNRDLAMCSLVGLARLALARGEAAEAVYLAAFAAGHYLTWRDIKAQAAAVLAQALARLDVAEGTRARQAGEAASLEAVLARAGAAGE